MRAMLGDKLQLKVLRQVLSKLYMNYIRWMKLGYKTVGLSEEAYNTLKALKGEKESFSDTVLKLARNIQRKPLSKLAGDWNNISDDEAAEMLARIARVDFDTGSML